MNSAYKLPDHYRLALFGDIDSTNSEALRRAHRCEPGGVWIVAERQLQGRGRSGRMWQSEKGNFYGSLLLQLDIAPDALQQLPLAIGVAAYDAISAVAQLPENSALHLKWPNDILLERAKLGGILIESMKPAGATATYVAIGIGLNLAHHPDDATRAATNLNAHNYAVTPSAMLQALAHAIDLRLGVWDLGRGNESIRQAWLQRAIGIGDEVSVKLSTEVCHGIFEGIDDQGALRLRQKDGTKRRITFGDVMLHA